MRRFVWMVLALAISCGGDGTSPSTDVSAEGTWTLRTIGGANLPYLLEQVGSDKIELLDATIVITTNGSFTTTSTERTTIAGQATTRSYDDRGNYSLRGVDVTFTFTSDGVAIRGAIRGDSLTFNDGIPVVYRKQ